MCFESVQKDDAAVLDNIKSQTRIEKLRLLGLNLFEALKYNKS
jgi:hypothetical protein